MLERLHFVLGGLCGLRYPRQWPLCSVELKRIVAERGRHSSGGHLCFVWCAFQVRTESSSRLCWWPPSFLLRLEQTSTIGLVLVSFPFGCRLCCCAWVWDVSCTYDWASVSLTVMSHMAHFPCFCGCSVTPSSRFPSVLSRPGGSFNSRILLLYLPLVDMFPGEFKNLGNTKFGSDY